MKTRYLLPHSLKLPGWIILGIGIVLGIFWLIFMDNIKFPTYMPALYNNDFDQNNRGWLVMITNGSIVDEIAGLFLIVGSLFVALSKEKVEDERFMKIRLDSLVWAVIVNSIVLIISLFMVYGLAYIYIMSISLVSLPLLFIFKFKYSLIREPDTEKKYQFTHPLRAVGWILLILGIIYWLLLMRFHNIHIYANMPALYNDGFVQGNNGWFKIVPHESISNELIALFIILGSLFVALSKEKIEDEFIMKIRLESLLWALIANNILLIICIFSFYGMTFLAVMLYSTISFPLMFLIKYIITLRRGY
ncbi:MAG: hypothetical protein WCR42_07470 [bacterium]